MSTVTMNKVSDELVRVGDLVCTDMHMHVPNDGLFKGWNTDDKTRMEISEDQFWGLLVASRPDRKRRGASNKNAFVVGLTTDDNYDVVSVMVVYTYDNDFRMSVLIRPEF